MGPFQRQFGSEGVAGGAERYRPEPPPAPDDDFELPIEEPEPGQESIDNRIASMQDKIFEEWKIEVDPLGVPNGGFFNRRRAEKLLKEDGPAARMVEQLISLSLKKAEGERPDKEQVREHRFMLGNIYTPKGPVRELHRESPVSELVPKTAQELGHDGIRAYEKEFYKKGDLGLLPDISEMTAEDIRTELEGYNIDSFDQGGRPHATEELKDLMKKYQRVRDLVEKSGGAAPVKRKPSKLAGAAFAAATMAATSAAAAGGGHDSAPKFTEIQEKISEANAPENNPEYVHGEEGITAPIVRAIEKDTEIVGRYIGAHGDSDSKEMKMLNRVWRKRDKMTMTDMQRAAAAMIALEFRRQFNIEVFGHDHKTLVTVSVPDTLRISYDDAANRIVLSSESGSDPKQLLKLFAGGEPEESDEEVLARVRKGLEGVVSSETGVADLPIETKTGETAEIQATRQSGEPAAADISVGAVGERPTVAVGDEMRGGETDSKIDEHLASEITADKRRRRLRDAGTSPSLARKLGEIPGKLGGKTATAAKPSGVRHGMRIPDAIASPTIETGRASAGGKYALRPEDEVNLAGAAAKVAETARELDHESDEDAGEPETLVAKKPEPPKKAPVRTGVTWKGTEPVAAAAKKGEEAAARFAAARAKTAEQRRMEEERLAVQDASPESDEEQSALDISPPEPEPQKKSRVEKRKVKGPSGAPRLGEMMEPDGEFFALLNEVLESKLPDALKKGVQKVFSYDSKLRFLERRFAEAQKKQDTALIQSIVAQAGDIARDILDIGRAVRGADMDPRKRSRLMRHMERVLENAENMAGRNTTLAAR